MRGFATIRCNEYDAGGEKILFHLGKQTKAVPRVNEFDFMLRLCLVSIKKRTLHENIFLN